MKIPLSAYLSLKSDLATVAEALKIDLRGLPVGGLWEILAVISRNRAYDDSHPGFARGIWHRVLPFDGRDFCWYYQLGLNDNHVQTALLEAQKELIRYCINFTSTI